MLRDIDLMAVRLQLLLSDDLRKPKYRGSPNLYHGHCYVISEAYYHLAGGKKAGLKPMFVRHEGEPHWWVQHSNGAVTDLTALQFDTSVPYAQSRGRGFLTKKPSRRARILISRYKRAWENGKN